MAVEKLHAEMTRRVGDVVELKIKPQRKVTQYPDHFQLVMDAGRSRLKGKGLRVIDYRLLFTLMDDLAYTNWEDLHQEMLASVLGVTQPTISRSVGRLVKLGFLEIKTGRGRQLRYRKNHKFIWRGSAGAWYLENEKRDAE